MSGRMIQSRMAFLSGSVSIGRGDLVPAPARNRERHGGNFTRPMRTARAPSATREGASSPHSAASLWNKRWGGLAAVLCLVLRLDFAALSQPFPEPGLVLYGTITTTGSNGARRVTLGTLEWTVQPVGGGTPIKLRTQLTNLNDQFSYVLEVPFETRSVGGQFLGTSAGALELSATAGSFNRATVTIDGEAAAFLKPAQRTFVFGPRDRGRMERVDLSVALDPIDSDLDGMDDDWEQLFFSTLSRDGIGDADNDGVSDLDEFQAGTNPKNQDSVFKFIEVKSEADGKVLVRWSSIEGRRYTLERSPDLRSGFAPIQSGIEATPSTNSWMDSPVNGGTTVFYRLKVER